MTSKHNPSPTHDHELNMAICTSRYSKWTLFAVNEKTLLRECLDVRVKSGD